MNPRPVHSQKGARPASVEVSSSPNRRRRTIDLLHFEAAAASERAQNSRSLCTFSLPSIRPPSSNPSYEVTSPPPRLAGNKKSCFHGYWLQPVWRQGGWVGCFYSKDDSIMQHWLGCTQATSRSATRDLITPLPFC